jgi:hypothetical protein
MMNDTPQYQKYLGMKFALIQAFIQAILYVGGGAHAIPQEVCNRGKCFDSKRGTTFKFPFSLGNNPSGKQTASVPLVFHPIISPPHELAAA